MERLTEWDFESNFCTECSYHGEPNGCNKPDGTCDAFNYCFEAWDRLHEFEALGTHAELAELVKDNKDLRNELCLRCGQYKMAYKGACDGCKWKENK